MLAILYVLLGAAGAYALLELTESDDDTSDDPPPQDNTTLVQDGDMLTGTDGDDTYLLDPGASGGVSTTISAGSGDDTIDLTRLFGGIGVVGSTIAGDAGNDFLSIQGESSTLSGGEGDDTILAETFAGSFLGGDGNDTMTILAGPADTAFVDGGAGDDTIDVRGSSNVSVTGGAGDDTILTRGLEPAGNGYTLAADGGDGGDTLRYEVDVFPPVIEQPDTMVPFSLTGGAGADSFEIALISGGGSFTEDPSDPEVIQLPGGTITDFEVGTDTLTLDVDALSAGYDATEARLTEFTGQNLTELVLLIESPNLPNQEIVININAIGLDWDDVAFVGNNASDITLAPLAVT